MLSATSTQIAMARLADSLDTPTGGATAFDAASPPQSGDIPRVDVADLVGQLQHNRVPLMAVVSTAPDWLAGHQRFQKELAAEREWHSSPI